MRKKSAKLICMVLLVVLSTALIGFGVANAAVTNSGLDIIATNYARSETDNFTVATINVNIKNVNNRKYFVNLDYFGLKLDGYNDEQPNTEGIYRSTLNNRVNRFMEMYSGDIIPGELVFYFRGKINLPGARLFYDDSGMTQITTLRN